MARFNTQSTTTSVAAAGTIASAQAFTEFTGTAPYTVTLPSPVLCPGSSQTFFNATAGTVTISTPSGLFSGLGASGTSTLAVPTNTVVSITSDGVNYVVLSEDGSALVATTGSFTSNVTANGATATVSLTPQTVTIAPTGASTIDNVSIGATTKAAGAFTTLTANSAVTLTANTTSSSTATGTLVVTGGVGVSGAVYAAGLNGPLTGTVQTAAQPNITSVGTLSSLTVSGNILSQAATTASAGSIQVTATDASLRLKWTSSPVADKNTWEVRSVGTGATPYLQFRTINDANTVFTDRVAFTNDGNVGIGTATPSYKLHAVGTLDIIGVQGATNAFYRATNKIGASATTGDFSFGVDDGSGAGANAFIIYDRINSAYRFVLNNSGNVGIGTTTPGANLEISAGGPQLILNANSQAVNFKKIRLASSNNTAGDFVVSAINDDNSLKNYMFYASNAGNIGLGSTAPGTYGKLDIFQATDPGTTPAALSIRLQGTAAGTSTPQYGINVDASQSYNNSTPLYGIKSVASQNTGQTTYGVHSTVNAGNSYTARFGVYGKSGFNSDAVHGLTNSTLPVGVYGEATNATGTTQLSTSAAGYFLNSSTLGAVSIGVYINTTAGPTSVVPLRIDHASSELLRLDSTGRMGIGTNSPAYKLEVATGTEGTGQVAVVNFRTASTTASYNAGIQIYATASATAGSRAVSAIWDADGANSSGGDYFVIAKNGNNGTIDLLQYSNAAMRFGTNYTNRAAIDMTLDASGNVGIGTTNPLAKTHFYGSRIEGDNNNLYARAFTFNGASGFTNPSIPIWSISTGGGYQMFTLLIKVFQTSWAGNTTIVSQGVAMISTNNSATSVYTPYAGTMTVIGGNSSNVGTLSWTLTGGAMPATLYYNAVRVSNYDQYSIVAELATSGSGNGAAAGTWGAFTG